MRPVWFVRNNYIYKYKPCRVNPPCVSQDALDTRVSMVNALTLSGRMSGVTVNATVTMSRTSWNVPLVSFCFTDIALIYMNVNYKNITIKAISLSPVWLYRFRQLWNAKINVFNNPNMLSTFKNANISNVYNSLIKHSRHLKI